MTTTNRKIRFAVGAALLAAIVSSITKLIFFHFFTLPSIPHSHNLLHKATPLLLTAAFGPESIAFDPAGNGPYTGVADGRILKLVESNSASYWIDFAVTSSNRSECVRPFAPEMEHICGRPLGLRFDKKSGDLYIADAYLGLYVVGQEGGLATPLVTEVEGKNLLFTNDMDIDEDADVIYFTDTSTVFQRRQFMSSILSGDMTGRLLKYDRSSKVVTVLLRGLAFANGVALSKDHSFLLVAETSSCRITKLWLKGPHTGKSEVFTELPGFPDNIRRNSNGDFWVALHAKKNKLSHLIVSNNWIGRTLLKLPLSFKHLHSLLIGGKAHATAIKLNEEGNVMEVLEDFHGETLRFVSEVEENDGKLWIGSVLTPFMGILGL